MPAVLGGWCTGFEEGGGAAEHVGGCSFVTVAFAFEVAGDGGVLRVAEMPMGPAVGRVGACVGAGNSTCGGGWVRWGWNDDAWTFGLREVGAMVAGALRSGGEATVLVGGTEMEDEGSEGLVSFGFGAPVTAGDFEETGCLDEVVAEADDGGRGWCVVAGCGEADAIVELGKEFVDGRWWVPWGGHAEGVCIELDLGDLAPSCPEVVEDLKARDATESEFWIG